MDRTEEFKVDWTVVVPAMLAMILDHPDFQTSRFAQSAIWSTEPRPCRSVC